MQKKAKSVSGYIAAAPAWARSPLREMRRAIKSAAPKVEERIGYGMPYYKQGGRLAYLGAFREHTSFFWVSGADKKAFAKELASQKVVGSTLQIPKGKKVPVGLIKKIISARVKANAAKKKK